jgi:hypothetical protein
MIHEATGRKVDEWRPKSVGIDNHWLDCAVLVHVGASMAGVTLAGIHQGVGQKKARVSFSEQQRAAKSKAR